MPPVLLSSLPGVALRPDSTTPMYRQLYDAVRRAVLAGTLAADTRLPPTRDLSRELGVSRNTVMLAFEQLVAEGYLVGRVGAGTFVSADLPETALHASPAGVKRAVLGRNRGIAKRGASIAASRVTLAPPGPPRAFRIGSPEVGLFPFDEWSRIIARIWRSPSSEMLTYGDPAGYLPLRRAIAAHAGATRAVRCEPDQVIVVSGSQQALDLVARLLVDAGDRVWIEDPGYLGARAALSAADAELVPVPIDAEGIDVAAGIERCPDARLAYVTPSRQFPLGVTMSLGRRLALLEWASRSGAWVLEDDYDSEYRYAGRPLAALQGLDSDGRVIYFGTFSKVMLPSLRLGYLIVPPDLVDAFIRARAVSDRGSPTVEQAAMAEFIESGAFSRHIRRMRTLYAARQAVLVEAASRELRGVLEVRPADAGMHLAAPLARGMADVKASRACDAAGIEAAPASRYAIEARLAPALLLGYAAYDEGTINDGVRRMAKALCR